MNIRRIAVVRYGVSNLGSMMNMLQRIGVNAQIAEHPNDILSAERLILPGVGAFDAGITALRKSGLEDPIKQRVAEGAPILGICLGMQLLGHSSTEGSLPGLGLINAHCVRFKFRAADRLRVPHMGWAQISPTRRNSLIDCLPANARFYFVHSYHVICAEPKDLLATTTYGIKFSAIVQRNNIVGAQFHPEKSHRYGMALLKSFSAWECDK
jgi:glutamine amidotransferase